MGADRAGALSSICNTCGSLYCMRTSIVTCFTHHKFSLSPFAESGVFSFRLVLSARAMVAPPLQPPGPPPPPLLPSSGPDQIRPPGTHEVPVHKCHQDLEKAQAGDISGRSWADVTDLDAGGHDIRGNYSPPSHLTHIHPP